MEKCKGRLNTWFKIPGLELERYKLELEEERITLLTKKDNLPITEVVVHDNNDSYQCKVSVSDKSCYTVNLQKNDLQILNLSEEVQKLLSDHPHVAKQ